MRYLIFFISSRRRRVIHKLGPKFSEWRNKASTLHFESSIRYNGTRNIKYPGELKASKLEKNVVNAALAKSIFKVLYIEANCGRTDCDRQILLFGQKRDVVCSGTMDHDRRPTSTRGNIMLKTRTNKDRRIIGRNKLTVAANTIN